MATKKRRKQGVTVANKNKGPMQLAPFSPEELLALANELTAANERLQQKVADLEQANAEMTKVLNGVSEPSTRTDIVERARRAELEALIDTIPAAVVIAHDPACQQITGNRAATTLLRRAPGRNLSKSADERERPDYEVWANNRRLTPEELPMQRAATTGQVVSSEELEVEFPDGERLHVIHSAVPLFDDAGNVRGCLGSFMDISARKRAEEALRESEERLRKIFEYAATGVAITDWQGQFQQCNPAYCKLLGYTEEELQSLSFASLVHPDDLATNLAEIRHLQREELPHFEIENRYLRKDGRVVWVHKFVSLLRDESGVPAHLVALVTDVTERRQAEVSLRRLNEELEERVTERTHALRDREARLQAILDTAADAIITFDATGIIQSINVAAERMFGYAAVEMIGHNVRMLAPFPDWDEPDNNTENHAKTGVKKLIGACRELNAQRKDSSIFPVELVVSEVGQLKLFTGILRDISRRKELERDVVEIASQEQRRIGQDLHDSVGQELTALNILADELAETQRTSPVSEPKLVARMVQGLQRSQRELRSVMRGLLPVAVDNEGLMAALFDLADRIQQGGKVNCTFDCPEPVSFADNLTATHLYLVAQEAVHNAIKHAQAKNIRISLNSPNDHLWLRVQDDGIGVLTQTSTSFRGLGLRIMHNRAAIIGATLTIQPAVPAGTLVTCVLARNIG